MVVLVGLVVYTIIDVVRSEREERYGVSRLLWVALIVLLPVIGSVVWLVVRQQARARGAGGGTGGSGGSRPRPSRPGPRKPSGPVAPDDDPEFLWRLAQQQRRAQQERSGGSPDAAPRQSDRAADAPDAGDDSPGRDAPGPRSSR